MEYKAIIEIIEKPISGEWGFEPSNGTVIKVIRNTNFSNDGSLNLKDVVEREISISKISKKKLRYGDILIEKSGGSPNQPVGRVVFFDQTEGEYLFSNFTSSLRPKKGVFSKYLFYLLYGNHLFKKTLSYQNKTTGILNLQLDRYLKESNIPVPLVIEQERIATILDLAYSIRCKNQQILEKYNELAQSVYHEIFGNPVKNEKKWETFELSKIIKKLDAGKSFESVNETNYGDYFVLKTSAVSWGTFKQNEYKPLPLNYIPPVNHLIKKGDILMSRMNTTELVGASTYIFNEVERLALPDRIWKFVFDKLIPTNTIFIWYSINTKPFRAEISRISTGTSGSMKNISKENILKLKTIIPPIDVQDSFAAIIESIEFQKTLTKKSLEKSEELFQSLLQNAFKGEL